jgi:hypothetical protein
MRTWVRRKRQLCDPLGRADISEPRAVHFPSFGRTRRLPAQPPSSGKVGASAKRSKVSLSKHDKGGPLAFI